MPLKVPLARLDLRKQFFSVRAVNLWNGLPSAIRESTSVNAFKNAYDSYNKNVRFFSQYVDDEDQDQDLLAYVDDEDQDQDLLAY